MVSFSYFFLISLRGNKFTVRGTVKSIFHICLRLNHQVFCVSVSLPVIARKSQDQNYENQKEREIFSVGGIKDDDVRPDFFHIRRTTEVRL